VKSKPKKQWKLKQPATLQQQSPSGEGAALVPEQQPQPVQEQSKQQQEAQPPEKPKPALILHPRMQAVQEWFNNRESPSSGCRLFLLLSLFCSLFRVRRHVRDRAEARAARL
jgi:hypothetical protein